MERKKPSNDEVRLKIKLCGFVRTDMHVFHGMMDKRVTTNRVIGHECSGIVDEIDLMLVIFCWRFCCVSL